MEPLYAALVGAGSALIVMAVTQFFAERRLKAQLAHDRDMRLRDERRTLLREFVECAYRIQNKLKRAGLFLLAEQVTGNMLANSALEKSVGAAGDLEGEAVELLAQLHTRMREIEILCGESVAVRSYPVNQALGEMFKAVDPRIQLERSELDRLDQKVERHIGAFCDGLAHQLTGKDDASTTAK